jgi:hypothetical protein
MAFCRKDVVNWERVALGIKILKNSVLGFIAFTFIGFRKIDELAFRIQLLDFSE